MKAMVRHTAPGDALYRTVYGEAAYWGAQEHLTQDLIDLVQWLVWSKTADGQRNTKRPKPGKRPGMKRAGEKSLASKGVPREEFPSRWAEAIAKIEADRAAKAAANPDEPAATNE